MSEAEFQSLEPFGIDDGELDGMSPQLIFVLGYELAQISAELESGASINRPVHPENRDRLERAAIKRGRRIRIKAHDDSWFNLETVDVEESPNDED